MSAAEPGASTADWQAADQAFDALLDLPREDWEPFIAKQPDAVQTLLQRLIAAHEASGPLDESMRLDAPTPVPQWIGAWLRGEEIGRGGMAVVYRAERAMGDTVQVAALKLLTVSALAADGRQHLLREHQALARLQHPGIVTLLDAGVLDDGTPYLAMPLVDGERIDHYCQHQQLGITEIVRLFRQVCDAVAYAHRRLVVHRDLKPGNILIDQAGHVQLLDFGIARLLDDSPNAEATATRFRALTPQYAAPEQFTGEDSGTAVDVFGLGAVLYQLLTGKPPRSAADRQHHSLTLPSRAVLDNSALDPARRRSVGRILHGDLDAILIKALDDDPARRYPDAAALDADLQAWQQGRPVHAVHAGRRYRLGKFLRRNRVAVLTISAVFAALCIGLAGTLWQARVATRQAERAEQVKDFLIGLFRSASPEDENPQLLSTTEVLQRGAKRLQNELNEQPTLRAELLVLVGRLQVELGDADAAESTLQAASATLASMAIQDSMALRLELALAEATLRSTRGEPEAMAKVLRQALELPFRHADRKALTLGIQIEALLAVAENRLGREVETDAMLAAADADLNALGGTDVNMVGEVAFHHALVAQARGDYATALQQAKRAQQAYARAPNAQGEAAELALLRLIAASSAGLGHHDEAIQSARRIVELARDLYPPNHPTLGAHIGLLATLLANAGQVEAAFAPSREALQIRRENLPADSLRLANSIYNHGALLNDLGRNEEALPLLDEASRIVTAQLEAGDFRVLLIDSRRLQALLDSGRQADARAACDAIDTQLIEHWASRKPPHPALLAVASRVAWVRIQLDQPQQALDGLAHIPDALLTDAKSAALPVRAMQIRARIALDQLDAAGDIAAQLEQQLLTADDNDLLHADAHLALAKLATVGHHADRLHRHQQALRQIFAKQAAPPRMRRELNALGINIASATP